MHGSYAVLGVAISLSEVLRCGGLRLVITEVVPIGSGADEKGVLVLVGTGMGYWERSGVQGYLSIMFFNLFLSNCINCACIRPSPTLFLSKTNKRKRWHPKRLKRIV